MARIKYNRNHSLNIREDEFYLISLDPGYATGMALFGVQPDSVRLLAHEEVPWWPGEWTPIDTLSDWLEDHTQGGSTLILYENFVMQGGGFVPDLTPVKVIGALQVWHAAPEQDHRVGHEMVVREPSMKGAMTSKGTRGVTDEKMASLGMKTRSRHINDAISHALGWLTESAHNHVCGLIYPRENENG